MRKVLQITQSVIDHSSPNFIQSSQFQDIKDELLNLHTNNEESVENVNQLMTTYLSINDQKNNDVVKLLTIFSVFFLPLTFIVGIYGMNFDFMPELRWKFGYLFSFSLMIIVVLVIYLWFKRKRII